MIKTASKNQMDLSDGTLNRIVLDLVEWLTIDGVLSLMRLKSTINI
jgi:hypothetical protein